MEDSLFPVHQKFPREMAAVGQILINYSELEIDLMNCVNLIRGDLNSTLKAMFRTRGEKQRIEIADALGRSAHRDIGLGTQFETAIADMQHCRKIRNQYAHAYWHWDMTNENCVCFVGLEDLARTHEHLTDLGDAPFYYIDLPLLQKQIEFMRYTQTCLFYLNYEGRFLTGKLSKRLYPSAPKQLVRPALHTPPG